MECSWLEDFLALVETANFSRAAEQRHLTQSAFSRRIQALEEWAGTPLFDRDSHRVLLTRGGEQFRPIAEEVLRRLYQGRDQAREAGAADASTLRFAATHALSLTFFPAWLRGLQARGPLGPVRLTADSMLSCERIMLQGQAQFLLCHHHPAAATSLDPEDFCSVLLGHDTLVPVATPGPEGAPRYPLPGTPGEPVPYLAYSLESGMGRILAASMAAAGSRVCLEPVFTSHVASVLESMALAGQGMAWLPMSLAAEPLATGTLVRAGAQHWDIPMEIRLYRPRQRQAPGAERFWALL